MFLCVVSLSIFLLLGLSQAQDTDAPLPWEYPTSPLESTVNIILVVDSVAAHTYLVIAIEDQALVMLH